MRRHYARHLTILFPAVLITAVFFMIQDNPKPENPADRPPRDSAEVTRHERYYDDEAHRQQRTLRWEIMREVMIERGLISDGTSQDEARSKMRDLVLGSEEQRDTMAEIRLRLLERGIEPGRWFGGHAVSETQDGRFGLNGVGYFEGRGVALGDHIPDLTVHRLDGRAVKLADSWRDRPALVVTGSLTCDITRERIDQLNALARRYSGRVNVVLLYTIEAVPSDEDAPGPAGEALEERSLESDTPARPQPTTLDQRIQLAAELRDTFGVEADILVDPMDNTAWTTFGEAPAMAVLVTPDSQIVVKQGWFEAFALVNAADNLLAK